MGVGAEPQKLSFLVQHHPIFGNRSFEAVAMCLFIRPGMKILIPIVFYFLGVTPPTRSLRWLYDSHLAKVVEGWPGEKRLSIICSWEVLRLLLGSVHLACFRRVRRIKHEPAWNCQRVRTQIVGSTFWKLLYFEWSPPWHLSICYWQIFLHSIWHIFWHSIRHSIWHIFWHIFWYIFWHVFWHSIWHLLADVLAYLLAFYLAFYLAYLLAYYLANLLGFYLAYLVAVYLISYLAFYLAYLLAFYLAYLLAFYLVCLLAFYLAYLLAFYLAYLMEFYLAYLLAFHLTFYLAYLLAFYLPVEVQQCTLSWGGPRLRSSGAHCAGQIPGWGPAVHTGLGRSQVEVTELRRSLVEVQRCTLSLRSSGAHWAGQVPGWGPSAPWAGKLAKSLAKRVGKELGEELARRKWRWKLMQTWSRRN